MSVSAHLTPEPERRLWTLVEAARETAARRTRAAAALGGLASLELAAAALAPHRGAALRAASLAAAACAVSAACALAAREASAARLPILDAAPGPTSANDDLLSVRDVSRYTRAELVHRLDRYLGGGVTSTPYYEDIIGRLSRAATAAERARRLLAACAALFSAAQVLLALAACR